VATKAIFGKPVRIVVDIIHAQLNRTEKMAFHAKYKCADELFRRS